MRAQRSSRRVGIGEVGLVVNVVASPLCNTWGRVERATHAGGVGIQGEVGANGAGRATEESAGRESCVELVEGPGSGIGDLSLSSSDEERCDGLDTSVDIAEQCGDVEVRREQLRSTRNDDVGGVDLEVAARQSLCSTPWGGTPVPTLRGPLLRNVLEVTVLVELPADNCRDRLVVSDTT